MKRCPQCEFVYEDYQTLCDMDGSKLAFDSRPLPNLQALAGVAEVSVRKNSWRSRLITTLVSLVLGTVLFLVYDTTTHRPVGQVSYPAPAARSHETVAIAPVVNTEATTAVTGPGKDSVAEEKEARDTEEGAAKDLNPSKEDEKVAGSKNKKRTANQNAPKSQPVKSTPREEKDSKVNELLKKTGRLLKKPFKF